MRFRIRPRLLSILLSLSRSSGPGGWGVRGIAICGVISASYSADENHVVLEGRLLGRGLEERVYTFLAFSKAPLGSLTIASSSLPSCLPAFSSSAGIESPFWACCQRRIRETCVAPTQKRRKLTEARLFYPCQHSIPWKLTGIFFPRTKGFWA